MPESQPAQQPVVRSQDKEQKGSIYSDYWNKTANDLTTQEG